MLKELEKIEISPLMEDGEDECSACYTYSRIDAWMRALDQAKQKYGNIKIYIDDMDDDDDPDIIRIVQNSRGEVYGILDEDD